MRNSAEIHRLAHDAYYPFASEMLGHILHAELPPAGLLERLYGWSNTAPLQQCISAFLAGRGSSPNLVRPDDPGAPAVIAARRLEMEQMPWFMEVQQVLLNGQTPRPETLAVCYGRFAGPVHEAFGLFNRLNLKRQCKIPSAAHLNRVGAAVYMIAMDPDDPFTYSAAGALHDVIEDCLDRADSRDGGPFGLEGYSRFLEQYIPSGLQVLVTSLTNHYDLILHYISMQLKNNELALSKSNILEEAHILKATAGSRLHSFITRLVPVVSAIPESEDFYQEAKWQCYSKLYIGDMGRQTREHDDHRIMEIKGVDLDDNAQGSDALAVASRIKNILKRMIWVNEGEALQSPYAPFNEKLREVKQDALVHARHTVLRDLLQRRNVQDHLTAALIKLHELEPVLYTDAGEPLRPGRQAGSFRHAL